MHKQVILIMEGEEYPFGEFADKTGPSSKLSVRTLVRKIHETRSLQQRNLLLDKISAVKSLEKDQLINIQTVLEEENNIHVLYQYVPFKAHNKLQSIAPQNVRMETIFQLKQEMLGLGDSLADAKILLKDWNFNNLGMDHSNNAKLYLDLNKLELEEQQSNSGRPRNQTHQTGFSAQISKEIRKRHFEQINNMFKPYLGDKDQREKVEKKTKRKNSQPSQELVEFDHNFVQQLRRKMDSGQQNKIQQNSRKPLQKNEIGFSPSQSHGTEQSSKQNSSQAKVGFNPNNSYNSPKNFEKKEEKGQKGGRIMNATPAPSKTIIAQTPSSTNIRRNKHNWKEIEQDSEFMMDFINVLDDEPNEGEQKNSSPHYQKQTEEIDYNLDDGYSYQRDEEVSLNNQYLKAQKGGQLAASREGSASESQNAYKIDSKLGIMAQFSQLGSNLEEKKSNFEDEDEEDDCDQQEVVWASPEHKENETANYLGKQSRKGSYLHENDEEVLWHKDSGQLLSRVEQAIQRSRNVIQVFKSITKH